MMSTSIVLYLVPTGYIITFNATEYEFDISVHSSVGMVVFEALLIVENITDFVIIEVNFSGAPLYSINEADTLAIFGFFPTTNPLLTITLTENLNSDDENVDYYFTMHYSADTTTGVEYANSVNVILHEIGKSTIVENFDGFQNFNMLAL